MQKLLDSILNYSHFSVYHYPDMLKQAWCNKQDLITQPGSRNEWHREPVCKHLQKMTPNVNTWLHWYPAAKRARRTHAHSSAHTHWLMSSIKMNKQNTPWYKNTMTATDAVLFSVAECYTKGAKLLFVSFEVQRLWSWLSSLQKGMLIQKLMNYSKKEKPGCEKTENTPVCVLIQSACCRKT